MIPVLLFLCVFAAVVYYGYAHFFKKETVVTQPKGGLNNSLPAQEIAKPLNKLELYLQAEKDSLNKTEQRSNDPYSKPAPSVVPKVVSPVTDKPVPVSHVSLFASNKNITEKEKRIDQQLAALNTSVGVHKPEMSSFQGFKDNDTAFAPQHKIVSSDPELTQLETMLDKLMDLQHPELVKQRIKVKADSVGENKVTVAPVLHPVTAVVHNTQVVMSGSTIKLRLTQDMVLRGDTIAKGSFVFGVCSIHNERLTITLTNLSCRNEIKPVSLKVYDVDGIEGIYIPGAISRDVAKEGTDQAIQSVSLSSYDPSLSGQVANAGLQATKALLSRKVKTVRVTVKAGHRIILQNTSGF